MYSDGSTIGMKMIDAQDVITGIILSKYQHATLSRALIEKKERHILK